MSELDLFDKTKSIASFPSSGNCRITAIEGKAMIAEYTTPSIATSVPSYESPKSTASNGKILFIGGILIFCAGGLFGINYQKNISAQQIQTLEAQKIVLESKISKIRDLVKDEF